MGLLMGLFVGFLVGPTVGILVGIQWGWRLYRLLTGCWTGGQTDDGTSSWNDNGIFTLTAFGGGGGTAGGIGSQIGGLVCGKTGDGTPHQAPSQFGVGTCG